MFLCATRSAVTRGAPLATTSHLLPPALGGDSSHRARSTVAAATEPTATPIVDSEWASAKPYHEIPGPKPYPIVGNVVRLLPRVGEYGKLDILRMQEKLQKEFGDIVRISNIIGRKDMVFLYDPKLVEKMFRNEGRWPTREGIKTVHYYRTVLRRETYDGAFGVITTQGKEWGDFRTKVNQPLMQPSSARRYTEPINEVTDDFIQRMRDLLDENKELPAGFINELYKWSLESIARVALDTRLGCFEPNLKPDSEPQKMIDAVQVMFEAFYHLDLKPSLWRLVSTPLWRRFVVAMDYFYEVADKYVNEAMERAKLKTDGEPTVLARMMEVDPKVAKVMVSDMLFGGVDTTSHFTASLMFHLAKAPEVQKKLLEELRGVLPRRDSPVTPEVLDQVPYMKACLKESLRAFPITMGNIRETQTDMVLGDYQVPKGVDVFLCHMVMSRDERHFPRPLSFEPERWLRGTEDLHNAHPFVSLPFGFGPRTCVGRRFAEMEVLTLTAKIIRNFWVEYHHGDEIEFEAKSINTITNPMKFKLIEHAN